MKSREATGITEPEYVCPWEIRWRYIKNEYEVYTEMIEHPFAGDTSKLNAYKIPDPNEESRQE